VDDGIKNLPHLNSLTGSRLFTERPSDPSTSTILRHTRSPPAGEGPRQIVVGVVPLTLVSMLPTRLTDPWTFLDNAPSAWFTPSDLVRLPGLSRLSTLSPVWQEHPQHGPDSPGQVYKGLKSARHGMISETSSPSAFPLSNHHSPVAWCLSLGLFPCLQFFVPFLLESQLPVSPLFHRQDADPYLCPVPRRRTLRLLSRRLPGLDPDESGKRLSLDSHSLHQC
jgi:hypothetical protein